MLRSLYLQLLARCALETITVRHPPRNGLPTRAVSRIWPIALCLFDSRRVRIIWSQMRVARALLVIPLSGAWRTDGSRVSDDHSSSHHEVNKHELIQFTSKVESRYILLVPNVPWSCMRGYSQIVVPSTSQVFDMGILVRARLHSLVFAETTLNSAAWK